MATVNSSEGQMPQRAETTNPDWNSYVPQGQGRTDEQIRADVHEWLSKENGKRTTALTVNVASGVVTLRGRVSGAAEQQRLLTAIRGVPSVKNVVDQLEVESAPTTQRAADLASSAVSTAQDRAHELAHRAQDVASNVGHQAQDRAYDLAHRAQDVATNVRDQAREYGQQAYDYGHQLASRGRNYAQRAGAQTARGARTAGDFVSAHAVPLALVGASLGYLFWSMRRERTRLVELEVVSYEYEPGYEPRARAQQYRQPASQAAPTTSGEKLLGVRSDRYYGA